MCKNKLNMKLKKHVCVFGGFCCWVFFFKLDLAFLFNSSSLKLLALRCCASWRPKGSGRSRQGHGSPKWLFTKAEIQSCPSKWFQFMLQPLWHVVEAEEATAYWCSQRKQWKASSVFRMQHGLGGLEKESLIAGYWIRGESSYVLLITSWEK